MLATHYLVRDAETHNADAHSFDGSNFVVQFVSIVCWHTVRDHYHNAFSIRSLFIVLIKHFQSCNLQTTRGVCILAEISYSVHGRQHFSLRRIIPQVEVQLALVSCDLHIKYKNVWHLKMIEYVFFFTAFDSIITDSCLVEHEANLLINM